MNLPRIALAAALTLLSACASDTPPSERLETPRQYLAKAEQLIEEGKGERAQRLLEERSKGEYLGIERERYLVALANAYYLTENYWDAYETLKDFPRLYPLSDYLPRAEWLSYRSGAALAATGWTFLGIVSDLEDSIVVLDHFLLYYPRSRYALDALRILGEAAYIGRDYDEAIRRYQELRERVSLREASDRAWIDLAGHRIAMAYFKKTQGPDYDAAGLRRAKAELVGYLQSNSTNAAFLDEARSSLSTVLQWIEEKHLRTARYYLRIEKPQGAREALARLLADPESKRQDEARALLKEVEELEKRIGSEN
ncbi:MAG: hypothetical protein CSA62_06635 [Planctomycetota bacterium]|nr:MAG: hypothetical protein CSA62_06635 [Planctomycetota bacterium]